MDGKICYINTDLDITSPEDVRSLAAVFESHGMLSLDAWHGDDGLWYARFEIDGDYQEPELCIAAMLAVVESLVEPHSSVWRGCTLREFNIGYDCGKEPWAFNQMLSDKLLGRIAAVGGSLRITLYPDVYGAPPKKPTRRG